MIEKLEIQEKLSYNYNFFDDFFSWKWGLEIIQYSIQSWVNLNIFNSLISSRMSWEIIMH